ncbi:MAG TPA: hypothetical protein VF766_16185, partial [Pyrinomonadaceae bacterium]
ATTEQLNAIEALKASTNAFIARKDYITKQSHLAPTGDIYPKYPCIKQKLKDESIIENGPDGVTPCGQERVNLERRRHNRADRHSQDGLAIYG